MLSGAGLALIIIRGFVGGGGLSRLDVEAFRPGVSLIIIFSDAAAVIALCTARLAVGGGSGWYLSGGATPRLRAKA
jgi:hypothetical protein